MLRAPSPRVLLLLLLVVGGAFTLSNRALPLVRNSLVYARASEHVIEHGYDARPVVADSKLSYDKPILYAWSSAPFVVWLGNHDGLRLTSFLTTAAYLLALRHFARSFRALLPADGERWVLWLGALGPCVFYQFWSAHPDGWFAALAVLAWSLSRRIVAEPAADPVPRVLALGATLLVAILLKNYGLVLLVSCPLYLAWHWRALRADPPRSRRLLASSLAVFAFIGAFVVLAWTGHNPLSRLEGEGGGDAQQGVYERAGLIRADITTRYASSRGFAPGESDCNVWSGRPLDLTSLGQITELGLGLQHVQLRGLEVFRVVAETCEPVRVTPPSVEPHVKVPAEESLDGPSPPVLVQPQFSVRQRGLEPAYDPESVGMWSSQLGDSMVSQGDVDADGWADLAVHGTATWCGSPS